MTRLIEGDHIRRLRAFKFLRDQAPDKSHATPELLDVLALLADYDRLRLCLTGVASCSICPACSGAAKRTLECS